MVQRRLQEALGLFMATADPGLSLGCRSLFASFQILKPLSDLFRPTSQMNRNQFDEQVHYDIVSEVRQINLREIS